MKGRWRTYGKINLWLRVGDRRPDGYHEIETVFHGISLADEVTIDDAPAGTFETTTLGIDSEDNLATKAARSVPRRPFMERGARIAIDKHIPVSAGLGGGSANAAGVLVALNELWRIGLSVDELRALALDIGSDVPFLVSGGTALGRGRGEILEPLSCAAPLHIVLGITYDGLSTRDVYEAFTSSTATAPGDLIAALAEGSIEGVAAALHNDLEAPAVELRPDLAEKKAELMRAGALGALVSGSGPTVFGIGRSETQAFEVADRVRGVFDSVEVVTSAPVSVESHPENAN